MDGKNFVKLTNEQFDVIMNDSTYPGTTGSSALYTYDHFKACREHLKPGGVLSCWMPLDLRPEDFQITIRSFHRAMPHCSLWMVNNCLNKHAVLIGTMEETRLDFARINKVIERPDILADLKEINIHSVYDFLDCMLLGEAAMTQLAGDGPLNTDDRPYLEFGAAIKRDVEGCWLAVLAGIGELHEPVLPYVTHAGPQADPNQGPRAVLAQYYEGTNHTLRGMVGILQGDPDIMNAHFERARQANPHDRDVQYILDEIDREIEALIAVIEDKPKAPALRSRLAKRYMLLRRFGEAAAQYERCLELVPSNPAAWNNLGACYRQLEQWDRAVEALERAIGQEPGMFAAYAQLAEIHEGRGDLEAAVTVLKRLLPLLPRSRQARTHDALARLHFMQKHYVLAVAELDKAIGLTANEPQLRQEFEAKKLRVQQEAQTAHR
jgi:spermidine synthase